MTDTAKRLDALDCILANRNGANDVDEELISIARRLLKERDEARERIEHAVECSEVWFDPSPSFRASLRALLKGGE